MPPLQILILSDGRPGHFNLSEGIAAAIERRRQSTTTHYEVRRGRWSGAILAALARSHLPPALMLHKVYGVEERNVPAGDLIDSAGAETLAASIWLSRARRVPNIFYGSLRLFNPLDFTLVLTSYTRNANRPRHALALKPSRLDPDTIARPLQPDPMPFQALALLVGGDAGRVRYSADDWHRLVALITQKPASDRTRWLVANSRRTPPAISERLAELARGEHPPISVFLDIRTAGPGTLQALLGECDAAVCTADSSSMISECRSSAPSSARSLAIRIGLSTAPLPY